jgi:predicted ATP-grasp superfamily ATP-dependent carboligase
MFGKSKTSGNNRPPAIVTNAKNRIAYNIVRSLGEKGIDVYTADFVPHSMSFSSRYSKGNFLYPSPFRDQQGFVDCLRKRTLALKSCVLIPVFEETFLVAKYRHELSCHAKMVVPDYSQVLIAHNKDRWEPIARACGIPVPETYAVAELQAQSSRIDSLRYPLLVKPKQGGGAWAIKQVNSKKELLGLLGRDLYCGQSWNRFFIQEKINGESHCVAMLFNHGELRAQVTYRQLRDYPVTGGQATLRVSIRNPDAESYLKKLLQEMNWHGVCQADFVVEKKTDISYLIDVNPRFWGSLSQAIASGVDFPNLLYEIAVNGDVDPVETFKTGVVTRWLVGDLRTFFPALKNSKNKLDFIRQFFFSQGRSQLYDDFCWRDPLPLFMWCYDTAHKVFKHGSLQPVAHDSLDGIWE